MALVATPLAKRSRRGDRIWPAPRGCVRAIRGYAPGHLAGTGEATSGLADAMHLGPDKSLGPDDPGEVIDRINDTEPEEDI
jgi:hypothetical protein